ncbi:hypothetical protein H072_5406 [Dactylellina haptotyla CBS 200.50]|uniref:DNA replication regulator Sld3 C-terminal domain-containing protein n=1 Tax=Dactylellina haptotyla (strain CBS 200.50) TaxID=1284197 RepID=S8ACV2_DACHA|nr:hypothetical protein H072_5406 [Dactylellina haptotyla CBS 200.50]
MTKEDDIAPFLPQASGRKRRRDEMEVVSPKVEAFLAPPFTIQSASDFGEEITICPRMVMPREIIPLEWVMIKAQVELFVYKFLDPVPPSMILAATLDISYGPYDTHTDTSSPVALIQSTGQEGIYGLIRLYSPIRIKDLALRKNMAEQRLKFVLQQPEEFEDEADDADTEEWWGTADLGQDVLTNALNTTHITPPASQLLLTNLLKSTKQLAISKSTSGAKVSNGTSGPVVPGNVDVSPEFILAQLKQQYYSLLYTSKSSLQYFPKTSLSRARVNFPFNGEMPYSRLDLLLCLENMVVLIEDCDEKYRSGIPEVAKTKRGQIGFTDDMTPEQLEAAIIPPNCLRENEIKYVLKWLKSLTDDDGPVRTPEQEEAHLQKSVAELRSRETELQIILLLEVLAIKEKLPDDKKQEYEKMKKAADRKKKRQEKARGGGNKPKRKKKMEHMVLLDLLVDRLCIWHSISADDQQKPAQQQNQKEGKDRLRHFCIEIVLAYYSSRLPTISEDIRCKCTGKIKQTKKLDRPLNKPEQDRNINSQQETQESMPDTTEDTSAFSKSVLGRPPTLSRSLTAPVGRPYFERTESSFSFSFNGESQGLNLDLAAQVSQEKEAMKTSFRGGITNTKKTADRRVVEVANPRAKKRKVDMDEGQLKDAIKNIAKPNRMAVAEEMVSASAQRMKITGRKPKKTIRNPLATTVQVAATPRKNARTAKLLERKPDIPGPIVEEEQIPSSSQVVPQSTVKRGVKRRSSEPDDVEATPSKAPRVASYDRGRKIHQQREQTLLGFLQSSPSYVSATPNPPRRTFVDAFNKSMSGKNNIFMTNTPSSNPFKSSTDNRLARGFMNSISETPTKPSVSSKLRSLLPTEEDEVIASSPLQRPKPGTPANRQLVARNIEDDMEDSESSIYKKLGWDLY